MPGAAAATQPRPRPGRCRRRRRSRPSDDAAAGLPPRSQCRPARARGAHTLTLAGADSHTRTHASEGSAAAATRAGSGGRRGARGRGAGPPGGAPANNVGEQPPAREPSFHPGKEESSREAAWDADGARAPAGGNPGARERKAETKRKLGERPGKPRRGGRARAHPAEGGGAGGGRGLSAPLRPALPREPRRFPPAPLPRERAGGGGGGDGLLPPGPIPTHLCLFSLLRRGRACLQPSPVAMVAPRTAPRPCRQTAWAHEEEEDVTSACSPLLPKAPEVWREGLLLGTSPLPPTHTHPHTHTSSHGHTVVTVRLGLSGRHVGFFMPGERA